jgi:putative tryptophan/tyrosine transport system substrate-binding protein
MMDRRRFLLTSLAGVIGAPLVAEAQQTGRQVTIGVLCTGVCPFPVPPEPSRALIIALERIGLTQGRTLRWDIGGIVNTEDQIAVEAQKLVSRHPDLILVLPGSVAAARAAKDATRTIPIVFMAVSDAVEHGLVDSMRHPGGNVTGISVPLLDVTIKQLQVLKEMNPRLKRIIVAQGHLDPAERRTVDRLREASASLGLDASGVSIADGNIKQPLATALKGTSGVLTIGSMPHVLHRRVRVLALERKLPLISPWRVWEGGPSATSSLITYGPHFPTVAERTASFIDRILKGARAGDLPVEEPTRYELVVDGVMAKALGLTIPPSVLARADQVLE